MRLKNTISKYNLFKYNKKIIGHNTDIDGFKFAMNDIRNLI